ncbi:TPA: hypothetical protein ACF0PM_002255 [Clostridium perfringens]
MNINTLKLSAVLLSLILIMLISVNSILFNKIILGFIVCTTIIVFVILTKKYIKSIIKLNKKVKETQVLIKETNNNLSDIKEYLLYLKKFNK